MGRAVLEQDSIAIVTVVMNRTRHLLSTAPQVSQWSAHAEHLIIDWSSTTPVDPALLPDDSRIRLIRVDGESQWQLARAYNFAMARAQAEVILKLDADCWITQVQSPWSALKSGHYRRYAAPSGGLNGLFMIRRSDFFAVGGFNEYLTGYGFDDKDLYQRLDERLDVEPLESGLFQTLDHDDLDRVSANDRARPRLFSSLMIPRLGRWRALRAIARMEETKAINRFLAESLPWSSLAPSSVYQEIGPDHWRLIPETRPRLPEPVQTRASDLGNRLYLSCILGLPERFLEMHVTAGQLAQIRRWDLFLNLQAMVRTYTLLVLLRFGLALSRRRPRS